VRTYRCAEQTCGGVLNIKNWDWTTISTFAASIAAVAGAIAGLYLYLAKGPKLRIAVVPPWEMRKGSRSRQLDLSVTNEGNELTTIYRLKLQTVRKAFLFGGEVTNSATFDSTTPMKPEASLSPFETKNYSFHFFTGWENGPRPNERIEIFVYHRRSGRPAIKRIG
jgi:hypothetical protein